MRIEYHRAVDLSAQQLARCRELSFGDEGYMCEDIDRILETEQGWCYRYSQAIILGDTAPMPTDRRWDRLETWPIWGWVLLQPVYRRPRYSAQLFVDPSQRGKGYGTILLKAANKWCKRPLCYVDEDNRGFFNKYPDLHENYEEKEIAS